MVSIVRINISIAIINVFDATHYLVTDLGAVKQSRL